MSPSDPGGLTHVGADGAARMVDVSGKDRTSRTALAEGRICMSSSTLEMIISGTSKKGEVLGTARLAGIMAGKKTGDLIPLCHVLPETNLSIDLEPDPALPGVRARASAKVSGRTGVEMEALTAVSVALLTVYDMVKAVDRGMRIEGIRLLAKDGGQSGSWTASSETDGPAV